MWRHGLDRAGSGNGQVVGTWKCELLVCLTLIQTHTYQNVQNYTFTHYFAWMYKVICTKVRLQTENGWEQEIKFVLKRQTVN
jgi:hypothetical protein